MLPVNLSQMREKGLIFDLDGVIVDTAKYHFLAWRRLADTFDVDFDEEKNEQLKGVSRVESLRRILDWSGKSLPEGEFQEAMDRKNRWYLEFINQMQPDEILPGVEQFLREAKAASYGIALGSASKNAPAILQKVGLTHYFDSIIDGNRTSRSKPDPEVFLLGSEDLGLAPEHCVVFEDAQAGIEAAKAAGMFAIGIGEADVLQQADHVIPGFAQFSLAVLESIWKP